MAFNVASIDAYVNETRESLIKAAVAQGDTINLVSLQPGVKYKETINILENTISVQDATCGFTSNGSVAFTQREITVIPMEIKEDLCQKTLEKYFIGQSMKPGSPKENELGAILADSYVEKIKEFNELNIWVGNPSPSNTALTYGKFDGFVTLLSADTARVKVNSLTGVTLTSSNIIASVDAMIAALPEALLMRNDVILFMSNAVYMMYTAALRTAGLYQVAFDNGANYSIQIPGTRITAKGTYGLTGLQKMVLTYAPNLVVATDLVNEEEKFDIFYSRDNDVLRVNIQWKMGVQYAFPAHIVTNF